MKKIKKSKVINRNHPWELGECYFVRTVTMHLVGRLIEIYDKELVFEDASWVADSGRFHDALKNGSLSEVEPFLNDVILGRDTVIDSTVWTHSLPREQK